MSTDRTRTFEKYWAQNWAPTGQPGAFDAAMREIALKAWNEAINSASALMLLTDSEVRLMAGELTSGELRTTKAVLSGCSALVRDLRRPEPA